MTKQTTPFFARFLTRQDRLPSAVEEKGAAARTTKYPSDSDEYQTMKYPSDGDEGG
ncbi:MAG TPA: microviridin/marinostatin family tricyclic proteinase inhibitor, partial [Myxococcota bacterium]|nr:microviridin/marinostatin family tricyclic proteinase inhibitor [Myxococcota bacterium]